MPLSRLLYVSENQLDPTKGPLLRQLSALMKISQRNNRARNITGALVFDDLWFIQALEGDRATILALFEHLKEDERHANVALVGLEDIEERRFGDWWMALLTRTAQTLPAFTPYLHNARLRPEEMTAREVLELISNVAKLGAHRSMSTAA